jgi:predicted transposase YdaD
LPKDFRKLGAEKASEGRRRQIAGRESEGLRIAQRMLANGIALETVLKITGLSEEDYRRALIGRHMA